MQTDLDKEIRFNQKNWKLRRKQLEVVSANTVQVYTDIQAVVGSKQLEIKALEMSHNVSEEVESD